METTVCFQVLLTMQTQDMNIDHTSPFFSDHSYTNDFAVITHIIRMDALWVEIQQRVKQDTSVQRVVSSGI